MDVNVHQSASARTLLAEVLRSRSSRLSAKSIGRLPQGLRMLSLLIRNVMWAAWWPYSAWLLSLEKAAKRMSAEARQCRGELRARHQACREHGRGPGHGAAERAGAQ